MTTFQRLFALSAAMDECIELARGQYAAQEIARMGEWGKHEVAQMGPTAMAILKRDPKAYHAIINTSLAKYGFPELPKEHSKAMVGMGRDRIAKAIRRHRNKEPIEPGFGHDGTYIHNPLGTGKN
jgi:hypothetical protein